LLSFEKYLFFSLALRVTAFPGETSRPAGSLSPLSFYISAKHWLFLEKQVVCFFKAVKIVKKFLLAFVSQKVQQDLKAISAL
jgi:hypothetical protein